MSLRSPSKYLNKPFLKQLTENRFLSPRGIEYCPDEVRDLLIKKEMEQAEIDFRREMRIKAQSVDHVSEIKSFQDSVLFNQRTARENRPGVYTCQHLMPCEFSSAETKKLLPPSQSPVEITSQHDWQQSIGSPENTSSVPGESVPRAAHSEKSSSYSLRGKGKVMKTGDVYRGFPVISNEASYSKKKILADIQHLKKIRENLDKVLHESTKHPKSNH